MAKKKNKITDTMIVPANGRPEEVKVGYRTIKIKYVRPDFIMDDMMDSYGEYRAREGVIYIQDALVGVGGVAPHPNRNRKLQH